MPNGGCCVYYPSNIFHNTRSFENWGISLKYSPVLAGAYSNPIWCQRKYLTGYTKLRFKDISQ